MPDSVVSRVQERLQNGKPPSVFLGLVEIAGYYRGLKQGFERLGVPVTFVNLVAHRFAYGGEDAIWGLGFLRYSAQKKGKVWRFLNRLGRFFLFLWAAATHDIFIFGCNTSFFKDYSDLKWLKRWGKTVLYQFHGSDDRPPYLDGSAMAPDRNRTTADCIDMTRRKKETIQAIEAYADVLITIPPQALLHERPFVQWLHLGLPIVPVLLPENIENIYVSMNRDGVTPHSEAVQVLHCPSHPAAKGSDVIRQVVQALQAEGLRLELIEIVNQPNAVVCEALVHCDIVIDQLYADYGMASFATEAAWFGKPVIVGGYPADLWPAWLPESDLPPTVYIQPEALKETLRRLATHPAERQQIGARLADFVRTQWEPAQIAARYLAVAQGDVPESWWVNPQQLTYWQGCCLEEQACRRLLAAVLETGGVSALQLGDKPELQAQLVAAAMVVDDVAFLNPGR